MMKPPAKLVLFAFAFLSCACLSMAQRGGGGAGQPATQPQATGTVSGHMYCSDTQRPARFAEVELLRQAVSQDQTRTSYQGVGRARTALDGSFTISGVAAGEYYVAGLLTGYVSASGAARMNGTAISAPMVHVDVNRNADVQISLERGAVVQGRVTYDDGTPIPGISVRLRPADSGTSNGGQRGFGGFNGFGGDFGVGQTDDRGTFRASGLPPGRYVVTTAVQTETTGRAAGLGGGFRGNFSTFLNVYAPATMHKTDARVIEIRGGETIDGVDIQVALTGLHTLQGSVVAKSDSHPLNSGAVTLSDAADASFSRNAAIEPDGAFHVEYLPPGSYTLRVQGVDRPVQTPGRPPSSDSLKRYQSGTATATVANHDVTIDPVQLEETKPAATPTAATPTIR